MAHYTDQTGKVRKVLLLVALGCTDYEIGALLGLATKTASSHVAKLRDAYAARSRTILVLAALAEGDITLDEIKALGEALGRWPELKPKGQEEAKDV